MMKMMRWLAGAVLATSLAACGGGGGSAGTTTGGNTGGNNNGGGTTTVATPTLVLDIVDSAGVATTTVTGASTLYARATAKDGSGTAVAGELITFSADSSLAKFVPAGGTALTGANGIAMVQIMPASITAAGAGTLHAAGTVAGTSLTKDYNFTVAVSPPTLTLDLVDGSGNVTTVVSSSSTVFARAMAKDSTGSAVAGTLVTFSADSGLARFVPAGGTALTNSSGVATVQVTPASTTSSGAGTLHASATVSGSAVSKDYNYSVPLGTSVDPQTAKVTNFVTLLDKSTLSNASTATAKLTVVAVDVNNNVVPSATVNVTTNANTFFTPGGTGTDGSGIFTGTISNSGDKTDRQVTITTTVNGITKQSILQIAGSQIAMSVTPAIPAPNASATLTARLTDATGSPISGQQLVLTSGISSLNAKTVTTDANGNGTLVFNAPSTAGSYQVAAVGSGVTSQLTVQVGSSVSIPDAISIAGMTPSLSALPNVVAPNSAGSASNQSQLKFLLIDSANQPVPNVRVRFEIISTGLGSFDSTISTGTSTVYTSAAGVATANFVPGSTVSPTDGVMVRACYQSTEFTSATQCVNSVLVRLTVASQALAISIGDDNKLASKPGTYIKQFVLSVVDAAGRAVAGASVDINLDITHYGKGPFLFGTGDNVWEYTDSFGAPLLASSGLTVVPSSLTDFYPSSSATPATLGSRVWCRNEDLNRNGIVDTGENINGSLDSFGQPTLEPRRSDIVLSYVDPSVTKTDASGLLLIQVEYSQRFATWLAYRIRASTSVAGSQGSAERLFVTDFLTGDAANGSFHTPPYGVGSCVQAN